MPDESISLKMRITYAEAQPLSVKCFTIQIPQEGGLCQVAVEACKGRRRLRYVFQIGCLQTNPLSLNAQAAWSHDKF